MRNKTKLFGVCLILFFLSCKKNISNKVNNNNNVIKLENNCQIPIEIENYLNKNSDKWSKIDFNDFNEDLLIFLKSYSKHENKQLCPYSIYGDFTNDGNEDFVIVLKNKNSNFHFLVVFNNYKKEVKPTIVYKTGLYKDADIKTVIYCEKEYGVLSYIEKGNTCGINVIDITYFEKSGFFVYWDKEKNDYKFLNYLDEEKCTIVNGNSKKIGSINGNWKIKCESLGELKIKGKEIFIEVNSNQIYIDALIKKQNDSIYNLYLKSPNDLGAGGMRLNWDGFSQDSIIASFNYSPESNSLKFNWYGFYDTSTKKRIWQEDSDFQLAAEKTKNIKLIKCD